MSRIFGRRPSRVVANRLQNDPNSAYCSLLETLDPSQASRPHSGSANRSIGFAYSQDGSRSWLAVVENRTSWTGERPPARKLVKDPSGSARPSFSVEISDGEQEKEKGAIRRSFAKLRDLYRKSDK